MFIWIPTDIRLDEDVLKTSFIFVFIWRLQDVFKMSWSRPIYLSWPNALKASSRRFQDVFKKSCQDDFKTFSKRLQDVLQKRLQDIFKTSCKNLFKTSSRRLMMIAITTCDMPKWHSHWVWFPGHLLLLSLVRGLCSRLLCWHVVSPNLGKSKGIFPIPGYILCAHVIAVVLCQLLTAIYF